MGLRRTIVAVAVLHLAGDRGPGRAGHDRRQSSFVDESGAIRWETDRTAGPERPAIGG